MEGGGEEVDGHESDIAGGTDGAAGDVHEAGVEAQVEHAEEHDDAGADEGPAAAHCIGDEEHEAGDRDRPHHAVDAGGQEGGGVAGETEVGEDGWGVLSSC